MIGTTPHERAYIGPFFLFLAFLLFTELVGKLGAFSGHWAFTGAKYWVFPVQSVVCLVVLWRWRGLVTLGPWRGMAIATLAGALSLVIWIAPQAWLGAEPRLSGFDPAFFGENGAPYWMNVLARMLRMVIVVPLVEELFWRGFLLRFFIKDEFQTVPFGHSRGRLSELYPWRFALSTRWQIGAGLSSPASSTMSSPIAPGASRPVCSHTP